MQLTDLVAQKRFWCLVCFGQCVLCKIIYFFFRCSITVWLSSWFEGALVKVVKGECCVRAYLWTHFREHAMTAIFCSESVPVNSLANFSLYPWLCGYKSALSHIIHHFLGFHLFNTPFLSYSTPCSFFLSLFKFLLNVEQNRNILYWVPLFLHLCFLSHFFFFFSFLRVLL